MGRYSTTPLTSMERYMKPQSTGYRYELREATFTDNKGQGVRIETEGEVGFSALPFSEEDLAQAKHTWELKKRPYIVLQMDATYRGVGNASCGGVDTIKPSGCHNNHNLSVCVFPCESHQVNSND